MSMLAAIDTAVAPLKHDGCRTDVSKLPTGSLTGLIACDTVPGGGGRP